MGMRTIKGLVTRELDKALPGRLRVAEAVVESSEVVGESTGHALLAGDVAQEVEQAVLGEPFRKQLWLPGEVGFVPAGTTFVSRFTAPFPAVGVYLQQRIFIDATREQVDHGRLQLENGKVECHHVRAMTQALRQLARDGTLENWPLWAETTAISLSVAVVRALSPNAKKVLASLKPGLGAERLQRVLDFIHDNLRRPFTIAELAEVAALSPYHFVRSFTKAMGVSPLRYVVEKRAELCKVMLSTTTTPLAEVAFECGYSSQAHMTTVFKRVVGATPGEYRRAHRG